MQNMRKYLLLVIMAVILAVCTILSDFKPSHSKAVATDRNVVDDMVDIDEMVNLEYIIADSSLMDAKGDISWHPVNDKLIRIKKGNRYYLRMQTEKETVTSVTYRYDDNSNNK